MPQLEFTVKNQIIQRTDKLIVVADSKNYLYAHFTFETNEWTGTKTALFRNGSNTPYAVILENDTCLVPWETLIEGYMFVSVFCGNLITANSATIFVIKSGYWSDSEPANPPTPSVYEQILERIEELHPQIIDGIMYVSGE